MLLNAKQIANYTGGEFLVNPIDPCALSVGITWDSREVKPGYVYLALQGERVDGHSFVAQALAAGANVALVMMPPDNATCVLASEMGAAIIEVARTETALEDLARAWRGHLTGKIIGLTGSSGKTTTKNLVRDVLSCAGSVVATLGNQNNELGVPKTLLAADPQTDFVVVEMGMRGKDQIRKLADYVCPQWGIITNVGESHIELLGSRENIAQAKAELMQALPRGEGRAFLCATNDYTDYIIEYSQLAERGIALSLFGSVDCMPYNANANDQSVDVWARDVTLDASGRPQFNLCVRKGTSSDVESVACLLGLRGIHNVYNACAAAAVGVSCGVALNDIAGVLRNAQAETGRQQVCVARGGYTVVNDAYNANPDSMRASLSMFADMNVKGKRVAVLGDMAELGSFALACHKDIGQFVASLPIDVLITIGKQASYISLAAIEAGMDASCVMHANSNADIFEELDILLCPDDAVLVKASNCMGLTKVVEGLMR